MPTIVLSTFFSAALSTASVRSVSEAGDLETHVQYLAVCESLRGKINNVLSQPDSSSRGKTDSVRDLAAQARAVLRFEVEESPQLSRAISALGRVEIRAAENIHYDDTYSDLGALFGLIGGVAGAIGFFTLLHAISGPPLPVAEKNRPLNRKEKTQLATAIVGMGGGWPLALMGLVFIMLGEPGRGGCADVNRVEAYLPEKACEEAWNEHSP